MKASPGYASPEEYFESVVSSVEGRAAAKRELLPGVGMKAAFVPAPPQMLVAVQRQDGVARLVGINFTKAQMIALARALGDLGIERHEGLELRERRGTVGGRVDPRPDRGADP